MVENCKRSGRVPSNGFLSGFILKRLQVQKVRQSLCTFPKIIQKTLIKSTYWSLFFTVETKESTIVKAQNTTQHTNKTKALCSQLVSFACQILTTQAIQNPEAALQSADMTSFPNQNPQFFQTPSSPVVNLCFLSKKLSQNSPKFTHSTWRLTK